jgi:hypothetical protein
MVTAVELLYMHGLVLVAAVVVHVVGRLAAHRIIDQINERIKHQNEVNDAQRKVNVWLADKCGEALTEARRATQGKPAKVSPIRPHPPEGRL